MHKAFIAKIPKKKELRKDQLKTRREVGYHGEILLRG